MRFQNLPLRAQLMVGFACLSIASASVSALTLTRLAGARLHSSLHDRSERIAHRLQGPLRPIVASRPVTALHGLVDSFAPEEQLDAIALIAAAEPIKHPREARG